MATETEQAQLARMVTGAKPPAGAVTPEFPSLAAELPDWTREKYPWLIEAAVRYDAKTARWRADQNFVQRTFS